MSGEQKAICMLRNFLFSLFIGIPGFCSHKISIKLQRSGFLNFVLLTYKQRLILGRDLHMVHILIYSIYTAIEIKLIRIKIGVICTTIYVNDVLYFCNFFNIPILLRKYNLFFFCFKVETCAACGFSTRTRLLLHMHIKFEHESSPPAPPPA